MPPEAKRPFERETALAQIGGDEELLEALLGLLRTHAPELRAALDLALDAGDLEETARAAHKLAGSVSNLHAWPTRDAALDVERAAEAGELEAARHAHLHLCGELDRLLLSVTPPQAAEDTPREQE